MQPKSSSHPHWPSVTSLSTGFYRYVLTQSLGSVGISPSPIYVHGTTLARKLDIPRILISQVRVHGLERILSIRSTSGMVAAHEPGRGQVQSAAQSDSPNTVFRTAQNAVMSPSYTYRSNTTTVRNRYPTFKGQLLIPLTDEWIFDNACSYAVRSHGH